MAIRDHTARARPSFPDDDTLTEPPGSPFSPGLPVEALLPYDPVDTALAVLTLVRLRRNSDRYRKARVWGFPVKPLQYPLSAEVTAALSIAIHCLERAAFGHGHVPTVNA
ncbi:hypothetical protein [Dyella sp. C11]|uniref:hypothetical protein n=1 Tax=Dyella sp. C11 TaxID=2126991 RepID=UPI000D652352|nr:hypothetical protein [Dyella sp. C11]